MMDGLKGIRDRIKPPRIGAGVHGMYGSIDRVGGQGSQPTLSQVPSGGPMQGSPPRQFGGTAAGSEAGSMQQMMQKPKLKFRA